jgi:hypothetical protein
MAADRCDKGPRTLKFLPLKMARSGRGAVCNCPPSLTTTFPQELLSAGWRQLSSQQMLSRGSRAELPSPSYDSLDISQLAF